MKCEYQHGPCCAHPSVANLDHMKGFGLDSRPMVNRVCLKCYAHWYGDDGVSVFQFTRKAWDRWICGAKS